MTDTLIWFRSDLRIDDNPALTHAAAAGATAGLFLISHEQWREHGHGNFKIAFLLRTVDALAIRLATLGIDLHIEIADRYADAPAAVVACAQRLGATSVHWNREMALNEQHCDTAVAAALSAAGISAISHDGFTSLPPGSVTKPDGTGYAIFTPFKKRWLNIRAISGLGCLPAPTAQAAPVQPRQTPQRVGETDKSFAQERWPAGETIAQQQLSDFVSHRCAHYDNQRDVPALQGTSGLSQHLAVGSLSANQCLVAAADANSGQLQGPIQGINTWVSELIWREFYNHITHAHPHISKGSGFKRETDRLPWGQDLELLQRWQQGATGIPLVDAGMRQLNQTGWMHNRLRMVTSQFLAKNLFLDWRLGESYFMQQLVDGDFAANNGGWQWSASTGTDAAPYFRIFNPVRQAERFDPKGEFVRQMIPQLTNLAPKYIFEPWKSGQAGDYPMPIVDLKQSRERTLKIWKETLA